MNINFEIHFGELPLWKGVLDKPTEPELYPFSLGWDERGYIFQTTPKHIQQKIIKEYSNNDYSFITTPPGKSSWGNDRSDAALDFFRTQTDSLKGKRILEIGGGNTYIGEKLLVEDQIENYTIIDPSLNKICNNKEIVIINEYFHENSLPHEEYDYVLSINCLEHVFDPIGFMKGVRRLVKNKKGAAILLFPDTKQQLLRGDFNVILHEHLSYFTSDSINNLARLSGLKINTSRTIDGQYQGVFSVGEESSENIKNEKLLIRSAESFCDVSENVYNLIHKLTNSSKKISFHGACNGLNTIVTLCDFKDKFLNEVTIFDGDEYKTGKYLSSCPNAILHSNDSRYKEIDHVIIFSMTYYNEIKSFIVSNHGIDPQNIHPLYIID